VWKWGCGVGWGGWAKCSRARLKTDNTRAETRFRLSPKRTSPFKSARESAQSNAGSRGVRVSGSNAGYTAFRGRVRVLATHSIRQFPLRFPFRVPSGFKRAVHHNHKRVTPVNGLATRFKAMLESKHISWIYRLLCRLSYKQRKIKIELHDSSKHAAG
jgi:hypothetical protein